MVIIIFFRLLIGSFFLGLCFVVNRIFSSSVNFEEKKIRLCVSGVLRVVLNARQEGVYSPGIGMKQMGRIEKGLKA